MELFWWEPKTAAELADALGLSARRARAVVESLEDRGIAVSVRGDDGVRRVYSFVGDRDRRRLAEHEAGMAALEAQSERVIRCPHCQRGLCVPRTFKKVEKAR